MRLKFLTISLLLLELALTEPILVRNREQVEMPVVVLMAGLALAAAVAVVVGQCNRPIPAQRFLSHLLVIGLLNALYGAGIQLDGRNRLESERAQRLSAIRAWEEGRRSPFYRPGDYEWAWNRVDDCSREITFQEERLERSMYVLVGGVIVALVAVGGLVAAGFRCGASCQLARSDEQASSLLHGPLPNRAR